MAGCRDLKGVMLVVTLLRAVAVCLDDRANEVQRESSVPSWDAGVSARRRECSIVRGWQRGNSLVMCWHSHERWLLGACENCRLQPFLSRVQVGQQATLTRIFWYENQ